MSSSPLGVWDRISEAFTIPKEGTAIRPFVRGIRLQIQSLYSDSEKQVVEMKEKVVGNVKGVQENTGKHLDDLVPAEVKKHQESWKERLKYVNPKPEIKALITMSGIGLVSYKFGARVFLRNSVVGGVLVAAYYYPNVLSRAWNKVPAPASIRIETRPSNDNKQD
eukprot:g7028.t1